MFLYGTSDPAKIERRRAYGRKQAREWYRRNKEIGLARTKLWQKNNYEKVLSYARAYYRANIDLVKAKAKLRRETNKEKLAAVHRIWKKQNKVRVCEYEKARELRKAGAMPLWADREAIKAIYLECARITRETGIKHHVDHVIPLKGKIVCGLHVETNLSIVPAFVNLSKHHNFDGVTI